MASLLTSCKTDKILHHWMHWATEALQTGLSSVGSETWPGPSFPCYRKQRCWHQQVWCSGSTSKMCEVQSPFPHSIFLSTSNQTPDLSDRGRRSKPGFLWLQQRQKGYRCSVARSLSGVFSPLLLDNHLVCL